MKKSFVCSLVYNGLVGGGLYLDDENVTYKTNKLTVEKRLRKLVLPLAQIKDIRWGRMIFPVATFCMENGESYRFMIFNKSRFEKFFLEIREKSYLK